MRVAVRAAVVLAVFAGVGWAAEHWVMLHSQVRTNGYRAEAQLGAYMAGLFAGGAAAVVTLVGMLMGSRRPPGERS